MQKQCDYTSTTAVSTWLQHARYRIMTVLGSSDETTESRRALGLVRGEAAQASGAQGRRSPSKEQIDSV